VTSSQVRELIARTLGVDLSAVHDELAFGDLPEWDSLNHVELMLALEQELGVEIGPEEMVELGTVPAITQFAEAHGSEPTAAA
jgi:acyl carrier protein